MSTRIILCGDVGRHLPCPVCKGKASHHAACSVPVLGLAPLTDTGHG